jgi:hypothetical protein
VPEINRLRGGSPQNAKLALPAGDDVHKNHAQGREGANISDTVKIKFMVGVTGFEPATRGLPVAARVFFAWPSPEALAEDEHFKHAQGREGANISDTVKIKFMVGVTGFEPATSRPPAVRASQLRHTPMNIAILPYNSICCEHVYIATINAGTVQ